MKRFRMKKEKIVKPDGRWMYMYTFEEEPESSTPGTQAQKDSASAEPQRPSAERK